MALTFANTKVYFGTPMIKSLIAHTTISVFHVCRTYNAYYSIMNAHIKANIDILSMF